MKQTRATHGDRPVTSNDVVTWVNRVAIPLLKELRRRYNSRHGEYVPVSADYSVKAKDEVIGVNAASAPVTITLLPASNAGCWLTVVKLDSSANAVVTTSADLINGVDQFSTTTQWASITFISTGTSYIVHSEYP